LQTEINYRILEIIDACKSIHSCRQSDEKNIAIKELLDLEEIYG